MSLPRSWPAKAAPGRCQPAVFVEAFENGVTKRERDFTSGDFRGRRVRARGLQGDPITPRMPELSINCQRPAFAALRRGKSDKPHVKERRPHGWPAAEGGRLQSQRPDSGTRGTRPSDWPTAKSPPRRRENSTGTWKIVILRKNKNSRGAKILFFGESHFRMISDGPKSRVTSESTAR